MKKRLQTLIAGFLMLGLATAGAQVTVLMDIGNDSSYRGLNVDAGGVAGLDENGNYWNSVWSGAFYSDLVATDNSLSGISFGFSVAGGTDSYNGPAGPTSSGTLDADVLNTQIDAVALGDLGALEAAFDFYTSSVFVIAGLDPGTTYTLEFFGSHQYNLAATTVYTLYDTDPGTVGNANAANVLGSDSLFVNEEPTTGFEWLHNQDSTATVSFSGLSSVYVGYVDVDGSSSGYLNAMSITAVPEPSTYAMIFGFLALAGVLIRRRFKN